MYDYEEWDKNDYLSRDEIWTVKEVAERWKVSGSKICELLSKGELKGFKIGYVWRIYLSEVLKFEQQEAPQMHKRPCSASVSPMPKPVITKIT